MHRMSSERFEYTENYLEQLMSKDGAWLHDMTRAATLANVPDICVGAQLGRLLEILVTMTRGECAVEVGTLGGYSAAWILRGLGSNGHLETIEKVPEYAAFAEFWLDRLGFEGQYAVHCRSADRVLSELRETLGPRTVDFVFLDGEKTEYSDYFHQISDMIRKGGLLVADNVLGTSDFWIDDEQHPDRKAIDQFNRLMMNHPEYRTSVVPIRQGLLIAQRL